jgi:hypothetical protein
MTRQCLSLMLVSAFVCVLHTTNATATSSAPRTATAQPAAGEIAQKVIGCFRAGAKKASFSVQDMKECSGYWVTPNALVYCVMQSRCAALQDTIAGREVLDLALHAAGLTRDSQLVLSVSKEYLPPMPQASNVDDCNKQAGNDPSVFQTCAQRSIVSANANADTLRLCFDLKSETDASKCLLKIFASTAGAVTPQQALANAQLQAAVNCMSNTTKSTQVALVKCAEDDATKLAADGIQRCVQAAGSLANARICITEPMLKGQSPLASCLVKSTTSESTRQCLSQLSADAAKASETASCLQSHDTSALTCAAKLASGPPSQVMTCLGGSKTSTQRTACVSGIGQFSGILSVRDCALSGANGVALEGCVSPYLAGDAKKYADCLAAKGATWSQCVEQVSSSAPLKAVTGQILCLTQASSGAGAFGCVAAQLGGDAPRIAKCVVSQDALSAAACLYADKPAVRAVAVAYTCASKATDAMSAVANCTDGLPGIDQKTKRTAACVAEAGSDSAKLSACAAGAVLPPEAARWVSCAANSQGPTSFALCAAGPAMNEEWRIAAECGVESGGDPIQFAGCTAGRLTFRELSKCFNGKVGKDCFGPNNTIVKTVDNAFHDLTQGPGRNNEIVKAIASLDALTGGPNSVINNPKQLLGGPNSFVRNPSQIWGGPGSVFNDPGQVLNPGRWRIHTPW